MTYLRKFLGHFENNSFVVFFRLTGQNYPQMIFFQNRLKPPKMWKLSFPCTNMFFTMIFASRNHNLDFSMFLESQRLFWQKIAKFAPKKCFFMVFENFQEGIFGGLRCRNFCRVKTVGQVSFCTTKKVFFGQTPKIDQKKCKRPPPKKILFFWGGGAR